MEECCEADLAINPRKTGNYERLTGRKTRKLPPFSFVSIATGNPKEHGEMHSHFFTTIAAINVCVTNATDVNGEEPPLSRDL